MPRVFVGNFDFEHELTSGRRELTREVQRLAADLVSVWIAVAEPGDVIWSPTGAPSFDFRPLQTSGATLPHFVSTESELPRGADWELVPWGWTSQLVAWGRARGWTCPAPPDDVIKQVNSRIFRWELEMELGVALPCSAVLHSVDEFVAHLGEHVSPDAGWVLKANYGMSGRERILARGNRASEPTLNWVRKRCSQSAGIVFEPWLERISEAGLQWKIPRSGEPKLLGVTPLLTDPTGTYRGSRIACSEDELEVWQQAVVVTRDVALRLQRLGYWGPAGIDAMRYRTETGEVLCRPVQDLNARYTMGRIALGLRRMIRVGHTADWLHSAELVSQAVAANPAAQVVQTTARSWLIISAADK